MLLTFFAWFLLTCSFHLCPVMSSQAKKNCFFATSKKYIVIPLLNEMIIRLYAFCFLIPFSRVLLHFFEMMIKVGMKRKTLLNDVLRKVVVTSNLFLVFFFSNVNSLESCRNKSQKIVFQQYHFSLSMLGNTILNSKRYRLYTIFFLKMGT